MFLLHKKNNCNLSTKISSALFIPLSKFSNSEAKSLCSLSASSKDKYPVCISL